MNDFQQKIANAPYSSDWFKLRNVIAHIVEEYMPRCKWYQIWEKKASIASLRWVVFMLYEDLYVWADHTENGLIESSQLELVTDDNNIKVLYSSVENASPSMPLLMRLINDNDIERIA